MSNEKQVEQLTTYMANFIAHIAKKLPDSEFCQFCNDIIR